MAQLINISKALPHGVQLRSPGGLNFDPENIGSIESHYPNRISAHIIIHWRNGSSTKLTFHDCTNGSEAPIYEIADRLTCLANGKPFRWPRARATDE